MGVPDVIAYFDTFEGENEWAALSNFWQGSPLHLGPYAYATGEHMFQALKARTKADHNRVMSASTPGEAKQNGKHMLHLRPDWERVKLDVMALVLRLKFAPGREEHGHLLATGDAYLVEGNTWGDRVWGVDLREGRKMLAVQQRCNPEDVSAAEAWRFSPGRNWLGRLLMARRAELVSGEDFTQSTNDLIDYVKYRPVQRDGGTRG
jgi:ribA/ribD-fused uncharacterized protein